MPRAGVVCGWIATIALVMAGLGWSLYAIRITPGIPKRIGRKAADIVALRSLEAKVVRAQRIAEELARMPDQGTNALRLCTTNAFGLSG